MTQNKHPCIMVMWLGLTKKMSGKVIKICYIIMPYVPQAISVQHQRKEKTNITSVRQLHVRRLVTMNTCATLQRQMAVTAHLKSEQLLPFGFAWQHTHHMMFLTDILVRATVLIMLVMLYIAFKQIWWEWKYHGWLTVKNSRHTW